MEPQESSADLTPSEPVGSRGLPGPVPPRERRARRDYVRDLLIDGYSAVAAAGMAAERFKVSARCCFEDAALVFREWAEEDGEKAERRRRRQIARLERNARECREIAQRGGDTDKGGAAPHLAGERDAAFKIGRLMGMGAPSRVVKFTDARSVNIGGGGGADAFDAQRRAILSLMGDDEAASRIMGRLLGGASAKVVDVAVEQPREGNAT